jgi:dynein heavy chain 1
LIKSLCDTLVPKLVAEDIPLLSSLLTGVFPGSSIIQIREERLIEQLEKLASKYNLMCKAGNPFIEKVL